jgi:hypothetical protein
MHTNFNEFIAAHQNCCTKSNVASENGKRFEINSLERFIRIRIDDCLIMSKAAQKCDFGFVRESNNEFYFVELKGKDVKTAFDQIINTITIFETNYLKIPRANRLGFIISSRNPLSGSETNNLKQAFAKKYGKVLEIKSKYCKHNPR